MLVPAELNYARRHWKGELSLPISFWVNFVLVCGLVPIAALGASLMISASPAVLAMWLIVLIVFQVAACGWGTAGAWRSSSKYAAQGGLFVWAGVAKAALVVGAIAMTASLVLIYLPLFAVFAPLAVGYEPLGHVRLTVREQAIIVEGVLGTGVADEIGMSLNRSRSFTGWANDNAPVVNTLVLSSPGGRLVEAYRLAQMVRYRGLNTYVADICLSACTYVLIAGRDRAAPNGARIGFHSPAIPGLQFTNIGRAYQSRIYRQAGIPDWFIERVNAIPPEQMWFPTAEELLQAHVLTRVAAHP